MILQNAYTKVSCKILLPCRFKCNLLLLIWGCFILFEWSINEKFFSLHSLAKCAFTYFALVWRWSFRKNGNMFFTSESYNNICNWFCNQFQWTVQVKVICFRMSRKMAWVMVSHGALDILPSLQRNFRHI